MTTKPIMNYNQLNNNQLNESTDGNRISISINQRNNNENFHYIINYNDIHFKFILIENGNEINHHYYLKKKSTKWSFITEYRFILEFNNKWCLSS